MTENVGQSGSQVDRNFRAFQAKLPALDVSRAGKLALMHDEEIVDFFDSYADGVRAGLEKYGNFGNFSLQEITSQPASLGFRAHDLDVQQ